MKFERVAVLDWSAAGTPKRGRDSIWLGVTDARGTTAINIPTRAEAEQAVAALLDRPTLIGMDFAFAPPRGLCPVITGSDDPRALWRWLAARVTDGPRNATNYRAAAAEMNRHFAQVGPFWGNGLRQDIPDLPRTKPPLPAGLSPNRDTDMIVRGDGFAPKPIWQLAGAGAVGAQSLTGMPMLHRLRARGAAVWPFDRPAKITIAEVYPAMLGALVAQAGGITDEAQVRLLSQSFWALNLSDDLAHWLQSGDPVEGTILGAGKAGAIAQALRIK